MIFAISYPSLIDHYIITQLEVFVSSDFNVSRKTSFFHDQCQHHFIDCRCDKILKHPQNISCQKYHMVHTLNTYTDKKILDESY